MSTSRAASGLANIRSPITTACAVAARTTGAFADGPGGPANSPPRRCADRSDEPLAYQNNLTRTGTVGRLGCHPLFHVRHQARRSDSWLVGPWGAIDSGPRRIRRAWIHGAHPDAAPSRTALARGCDEDRVTEPSGLHRRLGGIREFAGFATASDRSLDGRVAGAVGRRTHTPSWDGGRCPAPAAGILGATRTTLRMYLPHVLRPRPWTKPWRRPTFEQFRRWIANTQTEDIAREMYDGLVCESGRYVWELLLAVPRLSTATVVDFAAVTAPVLVMGAECDRIVPAGLVRRTAARYQHGTSVELPHSDHMVFSGTALPVTMSYIDDWMARNHVLAADAANKAGSSATTASFGFFGPIGRKVVQRVQGRRDVTELVVVEVGIDVPSHGDRCMAHGVLEHTQISACADGAR